MENNKNNSSKKRLFFRIGMIVLALAVISVGIGVSAKYVAQKKVLSSTLHVHTSLSKELFIDEHEIVPNGSEYELDPEETTDRNDYILHPGVNVPKDPTIHIVGKTSLKAYLFVEVVDGISETYGDYIIFDVEDCWEPLNLTGPNGGAIYVYVDPETGDPIEVDNSDGANIDISILKDNEVQVSPQWEPESAINSGLELSFYAYMIQCQEGDLAGLFTAAFINTENPNP